ncbi:hypothetical protein NC651_021380 [Populus alba x Populus x berolinensis]|nr:hypothetical protein NC651_021380 [Populus alba x Populus x berolinensis]
MRLRRRLEDLWSLKKVNWLGRAISMKNTTMTATGEDCFSCTTLSKLSESWNHGN